MGSKMKRKMATVNDPNINRWAHGEKYMYESNTNKRAHGRKYMYGSDTNREAHGEKV
jgi:hypothetical protein